MKLRGFILLTIGVCGLAWSAAPDVATAPLSPIEVPLAEGEKPDETKVAAFAPLAYFNQNCARCHGEYGVNYDDNFANDRDNASLHAIIDEMAEGPGQAPLTPAELDAVTAWHRALSDKKPFITIVKSEETEAGVQLSGEISPGATLEINGQSVEIDGSDWTFCVAPGAVKLRATKGDVTTDVSANTAQTGLRIEELK